MQRFRDEYPELAAMFQALQDGVTECRPHEKRLAKYELGDAKAIGRRLGLIAWQYDATDSAVAAGLRMVADAIDPPAMVEARHEIAETLGPSMLTPNEWKARLMARNMERHIHNIACFDIYGKLSIGCPDYDPPDAVNSYAKPYDDALAARERLRQHGIEYQ